MVEALQGYKVIGIFFGADWCKPCMEFKPGLEKLYLAQAAQGTDRLEIVLASSCREEKATKHFSLGMPWRAMCHDANNKIGMKLRTTALMAKFGIITIPALVLLDERGQVICKYGRGWCAADPMGLAFPWWGKAKGGPVAPAVVHFDLPPAERDRRPASPTRILPPN
jgi:hypothetical protein